MTYTITGTITNDEDGSTTEFLLMPDHGSYSQWGPATREQLGERVEYLDAMVQGLGDTDYFDQPDPDESDYDVSCPHKWLEISSHNDLNNRSYICARCNGTRIDR